MQLAANQFCASVLHWFIIALSFHAWIFYHFLSQDFVRDLSKQMDTNTSANISPKENSFNYDDGKSDYRPKRQSPGRMELCETNYQYVTPQAALNSQGNTKLKYWNWIQSQNQPFIFGRQLDVCGQSGGYSTSISSNRDMRVSIRIEMKFHSFFFRAIQNVIYLAHSQIQRVLEFMLVAQWIFVAMRTEIRSETFNCGERRRLQSVHGHILVSQLLRMHFGQILIRMQLKKTPIEL